MRTSILVAAAAILVTAAAPSLLAINWLPNQSFYSSIFGSDQPYEIILPDDYNKGGRFPTLYLLHDRNQNQHSWWVSSTLSTTMPGRAFVVVMAYGDNSWYMEDYYYSVNRDLVTHIETKYRVTQVRGICGIGMGGYGAFYAAAYSPALIDRSYRSISSMSGAFVDTGVPNSIGDVTYPIISRGTLGQALAPGTIPAHIYMDVGGQDNYGIPGVNLVTDNNDMRNQLLTYGRVLNKDLFFAIPDGQHDWTYWNQRTPLHLNFHEKIFNSYPVVAITNYPENTTVPIGTYVITVDGTAYVADGIKKVTWQLKQSGAVIGEGKANGTNEWSVVLTNVLGRNNFYVTAEAESGTSIWATTTFVLNDIPTIVITSFPENVQTVIVDPTQRVAGTAASLSGISNVTYKLKVGTDVTQGTAVGTNAWYVDVICQPGKNKFKATAMSGSGKTNTAECTLFLRNPNFRIRKVKVKERRVFIKTSDPTQGDVDSLTNGYGGVGYVMLGDYTMPLTNLYWKRKGQYNAKYLLKDANGKDKMSIKGKAQQDKCIIVSTINKNSTGITNFLDLIAFETNIALEIQLDSYGVNTNVTLDAKGKYKWNGSWF